jgi:hypothetical protein
MSDIARRFFPPAQQTPNTTDRKTVADLKRKKECLDRGVSLALLCIQPA